jgi:signal transduction histidine kinase/ligand-binding sensor domain-containing protein/DNA-binding response OmpR family regulator
MKSLSKYLLTLFLVLLGTDTATQTFKSDHQPATADFRFDHIGLAEGLSQSSVFCMLQDRRGLLWFGTANGLNKFDGYTFKDYRHNPADTSTLSHDYITCLFEDRDQNLWVGTSDGLNVLRLGGPAGLDIDNNQFIRFKHNPADPSSLSGSRINAIFEDQSGAIWIGTTDGLNKFDKQTRKFTRYISNPNAPLSLSGNNVSAILEDSEGLLWVGTSRGGLNRFNKDRDRIRYYRGWDDFAHVQYTAEMLELVEELMKGRPPRASVLQPGNSVDVSKDFEIEKTQDVLVISAGEGVEGMADFGEIRRAGESIWKMQAGRSKHGGGHLKNRLQLALLKMESGRYSLRYRSDESHSFGDWNSLPPTRPEFWGVQLLPITDTEAAKLEEQIQRDFYTPRISSDRISTLFEDRSGNIWVGTLDGGVNKYDRQTDSFLDFNVDDSKRKVRYPDGIFRTVEALIGEGAAIAGISEVGNTQDLSREFQINRRQKIAIVCQGEAHEALFDYGEIARAGEVIWRMDPAKTSHGGGATLNRIQIETATLEPGNYTLRFRSDDSHSYGNWSRVRPDRPELWGVRVFRITGEAEKRIRSASLEVLAPRAMVSHTVNAIAQDNKGTIWIGTGGGLSAFLGDRQGFVTARHDPRIPHSLSRNQIASLVVDESGLLWAGTVLGGLNKLNPLENQFQSYHYNANIDISLADKLVYSFCETGELVWIGTSNGLSLFDPVRNQFQPLTGRLSELDRLKGYWVTTLLTASDSTIWVGTLGGLFRVAPETMSPGSEPNYRLERFPENVPQSNKLGSSRIRALYQDRQGDIWIGTAGDGLYRFSVRSGGEMTLSHFLKEAWIRTIFEDGDGEIWLGTEGTGLYSYNRHTHSFSHYENSTQDTTTLSQNVVNSIYQDASGLIWIATYGGGLNRFNNLTGKFERFDEATGLPNNILYGILPDGQGNLWLSSNKGLSEFDPRSKLVRNFDVEDGLQSNEFNTGAFFKSRHNGELYFGGVDGFTRFHPDNLQQNAFVPPVLITEMKKFDNPVHLENLDEAALRLAHDENFVSFEFAALDYANPQKAQYAYRLDGLDKDWTHCGPRRYTSYANLAPGDYVFRVKGSNSDGIWNEAGASIRITVIPPWWQTVRFRLLVISGSMALAFALFRLRVRRLKLQKSRLEKLVSERTSDLEKRTTELETQRRLAEQAKNVIAKQAEKLRELDRVKSRFFANISHEFRTPLTLILGPTEEAIADGHDEKSKTVFRNVRRNAKRLLVLINQLLELAKIESGKMKLDLKQADIVAFVRGTFTGFQQLAEQKQIQLYFSSEVERCEFYFDRDKIEKIVHNLLSNAIKFTPANGKVHVKLAAQTGQTPQAPTSDDAASSAAAPGLFILTVTDTGIGIATNRLLRIFDRFYQADASGTREHEGTGIGLSLTKELVELHCGTIQAASSQGKGTAFVITLPMDFNNSRRPEVREGRKSQESDYRSMPTGRVHTPGWIKGTRSGTSSNTKPLLLVVEDNLELRDYVKECMADSYRVIEAANGSAGVEQAMQNVPDLIISDIMMPQMNGMDLCGILKADTRTCHIPIILLTAKADQDDKLDGLRGGADDYVTKPFTVAEIQVRVANLIEQRRKLRHYFSQRVLLKPDDGDELSLDDAFLQKVRKITVENMEDPDFSVEALARELAVSRMQLHRKLKALTGQTCTEFIRTLRLLRAKQLLQQGRGSVTEIAFEVGFNHLSYFSKCFRTHYGHLPSEEAKSD